MNNELVLPLYVWGNDKTQYAAYSVQEACEMLLLVLSSGMRHVNVTDLHGKPFNDSTTDAIHALYLAGYEIKRIKPTLFGLYEPPVLGLAMKHERNLDLMGCDLDLLVNTALIKHLPLADECSTEGTLPALTKRVLGSLIKQLKLLQEDLIQVQASRARNTYSVPQGTANVLEAIRSTFDRLDFLYYSLSPEQHEEFVELTQKLRLPDFSTQGFPCEELPNWFSSAN